MQVRQTVLHTMNETIGALQNELARAFEAAGDARQAATMALAALARIAAAYPAKSVVVANQRLLLAEQLRRSGELVEAEEIRAEANEIIKLHYG